MRQRQRELASLLPRLSRSIDITRVGGAQRFQITLQDSELLTQIPNLSLQFLHLLPSPSTTLPRFTASRAEFLLQTRGFWWCRVEDDATIGRVR
jgi:hypothetical protein